MAKYLVKEKSYVVSSIAEEGAIVDYTPPEGVTVSANLEPHRKEEPHEKGEKAHEHAAQEEEKAEAEKPKQHQQGFQKR